MEFTKMHGIGNDYIVLNCMEEFPSDPAELARKLSHRQFGIGSDGLICICPSNHADFRMRMFNADGSEGTMCGNGIRCAAKYAFEKGVVSKQELTIETHAGLRKTNLIFDEGVISAVTVDMGEPTVKGTETISVKDNTYTGFAICVGNPHFVVPFSNLAELKLCEVGPAIEANSRFPDGVNVEFMKVMCKGAIQVRVWERGSGETMACGTGACAAAVAATIQGHTDREVTVYLPGGTLEVCWEKKSNHLVLRGSAVTVFEGRI